MTALDITHIGLVFAFALLCAVAGLMKCNSIGRE